MMMFFLRLLPPEVAHKVTLLALQMGLGPRLKNKADLRRTLFGKPLRNPIGLASGADKGAVALSGWSKMGFGLVEAGSIAVHPRKGNPHPRMWRMSDCSAINWMGLPGSGIESAVKNLAAFQAHPLRKELCVGANIVSPDGVLDDFRVLAKALAPYVDYITLNVSCPNVENAPTQDIVAQQIKATKEGAGSVPVLLKLGPTKDKASLERMVKAALAAGVDGFVATNTVPFASRELLPSKTFVWPTHNGKEVGGYSGPQLLDISTWMVREIRSMVPATMPIIGVGGIQSGEDAQRMLASGANAIQIYTGLIYKGPDLLNDIAAALA